MYAYGYITGVTLHPENQTYATGQTIKLTCDVYGAGADNDLVYQLWTRSGWRSRLAPVVVNGSNTLAIRNARVNNSGVYNCRVFNAGNNNTVVKSNSAIVTILGMLCIYCRAHTIFT